MLTAYDYPTAKILARAGIDIILVGDSLGMVVLGYKDTQHVTLDDMIRHGQAVVRGNEAAFSLGFSRSFVVVDVPYGSTTNSDLAVYHCSEIMRRTNASAVKIEGQPDMVSAVVSSGIPVMGHAGLKPQTAQKYCLQGKNEADAKKVFDEALALEKAGVFALVLECIPSSLAEEITRALSIPTIGIGAGKSCDGQVLVVSDMIGLFDDFSPGFVKRYAQVGKNIEQAVLDFKKDVACGRFPLA